MLNNPQFHGDSAAWGSAPQARSSSAQEATATPSARPTSVWRTVRSYALWIVLPAAFGWLIDSEGVIGTAFFTVVGITTCLAVA